MNPQANNPAEAWLRERGIEPAVRRGPWLGSALNREPTRALNEEIPAAMLGPLPDAAHDALAEAETMAIPGVVLPEALSAEEIAANSTLLLPIVAVAPDEAEATAEIAVVERDTAEIDITHLPTRRLSH